MLLTDDAVLRISLGDRRADEKLHLAVGIGDKILVALALDGQVFEIAKIFQSELAGAAREVDGEMHALVEVVGHREGSRSGAIPGKVGDGFPSGIA